MPIAVVTGASRGVGRGVALALGDQGYEVWVTGRTLEGERSITATADEVTKRGGKGVPCRVDHTDDAQVAALFEKLGAQHGALDLLVNNVFKIPEDTMFGVPFWEQRIGMWDDMHSVGLRSHFVASVHAAPWLIAAERGLVANISSFAGGGFQLNVAYGVGKAGVDRLAADMAHDFHPHGVASVSLWPGIVRTEYVLENEADLPFDTKVSESPELTGRVIAALAADGALMERTGKRLVVAELAQHYDIEDIDGRRPPSLRRSKP